MAAVKPWLSVLAAVVLAAAAAAQPQERIKMCGRELIRLAVTTCGDSRLRRSLRDVGPSPHQTLAPHRNQDASTEEHRAAESDQSHVLPSSSHWFPSSSHWFPSSSDWFPSSSRFRRAAGKISDICCEKGCSMRELIQFC